MAESGIVAAVEKGLKAVDYEFAGPGLDQQILGKKAAAFIDRPGNEVDADIGKAVLADIKELGAKLGIGGGETASAAAAPAARATGKAPVGREV